MRSLRKIAQCPVLACSCLPVASWPPTCGCTYAVEPRDRGIAVSAAWTTRDRTRPLLFTREAPLADVGGVLSIHAPCETYVRRPSRAPFCAECQLDFLAFLVRDQHGSVRVRVSQYDLRRIGRDARR